MKTRGRNPAYTVLSVSFLIAFAVLALFYFVYLVSPLHTLSGLALNDETIPVSITVYGRGNDTISARLVFYAADGTVLNTVERSWPGWEISLDVLTIKSGSGWIIFPLTVRTDETRDGQGVTVLRYYSRSGFPALYESGRIAVREQNALRRLFSFGKHDFAILFSRKFQHRVATLREFETGTEYFLFVDSMGNLSFR